MFHFSVQIKKIIESHRNIITHVKMMWFCRNVLHIGHGWLQIWSPVCANAAAVLAFRLHWLITSSVIYWSCLSVPQWTLKDQYSKFNKYSVCVFQCLRSSVTFSSLKETLVKLLIGTKFIFLQFARCLCVKEKWNCVNFWTCKQNVNS